MPVAFHLEESSKEVLTMENPKEEGAGRASVSRSGTSKKRVLRSKTSETTGAEKATHGLSFFDNPKKPAFAGLF